MNTKTTLKNKYCLISFGITAVLAVIIFSLCNRMIGGEYTFIHSDCMQQYVPALKLFVRNLFSGKSLEYSFNVSMGTETLPLFAFFGAFSPVNIFYAIIDDVNIATMFVSITKLSLASMTFYIFLNNVFKRDTFEKILFSVMYGLSGFFLVFYFNILFLDGAYVLPLVIMLIHRLISKGRFLSLIPVYSYIFIVSFYQGYIIGIFSVVYLVVFSVAAFKRDYKKILMAILKLAISGILSTAIAAVTLYPTIRYVMENSNGELNSFGGLNVNIFDIAGNLFIGQMQSVDGIYPFIYCGLLSVILMVLYFLNKKIPIKDKVATSGILIFLVMCSLVNGLYLLMHAFNAPDSFGFRFAYLYSFIILVTAVKGYGSIKDKAADKIIQEKNDIKMLIIAGALFVIYIISFLIQKKKISDRFISVSGFTIGLNGFLLLFYSVIISRRYKLNKKIFNLILGIIVSMELIFNGYLTVSRIAYAFPDLKNQYYDKDKEANIAVDTIESINDEEFYRVFYYNVISENYSWLYGYNGIGSFSSIENVNLHNTLHRLGYITSPATVADYGGTRLTKMLFGQKYEINGYYPSEDTTYVEPTVYINEEALGLGYMTNEAVLDLTFAGSDKTDNNVFANQNMLLSAMLGREIKFWKSDGISYSIVSNGLILEEDKDNSRWKIYVDDSDLSDRYLTCRIDSDELEMYGYVSTAESRNQGTSPYCLSFNGDSGCWTSGSYLGTPHIVKLGRDSEDLYELSFYFNDSTDQYAYFNKIHICYPDNDILLEVHDELAKNEMEINSFSDTYINATVSATNNKNILFTTIPYDSDWNVKIDGVNADTLSVVDGTFLAVQLTEGKHTVEFIYKNKSIITGFYISLLGLILFALLVIADKKKYSKKIKIEGETREG